MEKVFNLETVQDAAKTVGIPPQTLQHLANTIHNNVKVELEPKKRGGFRKICKPSFKLKRVQKAINKNILQLVPLPSFLYGSVKGKSPKALALLHSGRPFVLTVDIKDFYPNIHYTKITNIFREIGCSDDVAKFLTKLCSFDGCLAQGFPTSSTIANLVLSRITPRVIGIEKEHNIKIGSYQDDLIISGGYRIPKLFSLFERIMRQEGFVLHLGEKKKEMPRGQRQEVLGYVINSKVNIPREYYQQVRKTIHLCKVHGFEKVAGEMPVDEFRQSLNGRIQYIAHVNPSLGKKLIKELSVL